MGRHVSLRTADREEGASIVAEPGLLPEMEAKVLWGDRLAGS